MPDTMQSPAEIPVADQASRPMEVERLPGTPLAQRAGLPSVPPIGYPLEQVAVGVPLVDPRSGSWHLAVVPASGSLSLEKARRVCASPLLRRATLAETRTRFPDFAPSSLPPFAGALGVASLVDRRLLTYNRVVCGSGREGHALLADAESLLGRSAELADLCESDRR